MLLDNDDKSFNDNDIDGQLCKEAIMQKHPINNYISLV